MSILIPGTETKLRLSASIGSAALGIWTKSTIAASQTDIDLNYGGVLTGGRFVAPVRGHINGYTWDFGFPVSAGAFLLSIMKNGASQTTVGLSTDRGAQLGAGLIDFNAGDTLSFRYSTSGGYIGSAVIVVQAFASFEQ